MSGFLMINTRRIFSVSPIPGVGLEDAFGMGAGMSVFRRIRKNHVTGALLAASSLSFFLGLFAGRAIPDQVDTGVPAFLLVVCLAVPMAALLIGVVLLSGRFNNLN